MFRQLSYSTVTVPLKWDQGVTVVWSYAGPLKLFGNGGTIGTYVVSRKKLDRESVAVQTRTCKLTPSP